MCDEYIKIYKNQKMLNVNDENCDALKKIIEDNYKVVETVNSAETSWILNSLRWKIVSKIKVPEFVKNVIRKIAR